MKETIALLLLAMVVYTHAHAVMVKPVPYNPQPDKTGACGVSTVTQHELTTSQATWKVGTQVTITWQVVAADGAGATAGAFDPKGGSDFTVSAWAASSFVTPKVGTFTKTFTVPNMNCAANPTKLCTFQVRTNNGWTSCAAVDVTSANTGNVYTDSTTVCTQLPNATSFCDVTTANIPSNANAYDLDAGIESAYLANLNNTNVFKNGESAACLASYKTLICDLTLPQCNVTTGLDLVGATACHSQCQKAMADCQITESEFYLYDCSTLPLCPGETMSSSSIIHPLSLVFLAGMLFAMLL